MIGSIKDYTITEVIQEKDNIAILRATRPGQGKSSLKILKKSSATPAQIQEISNEFEIENTLSSPHAVHAYELVSTEDLLGFSMDDLPLKNLAQHIAESSTNLEDHLEIGIDLAQGIGEVHLGEIALDKLIESLMHILIVNAGADRAFLILVEEGRLFVHSQIYLNNRYVPLEHPLALEEKGKELSLGVVNYVFRTQNSVLLEDAAQMGLL